MQFSVLHSEIDSCRPCLNKTYNSLSELSLSCFEFVSSFLPPYQTVSIMLRRMIFMYSCDVKFWELVRVIQEVRQT